MQRYHPSMCKLGARLQWGVSVVTLTIAGLVIVLLT